MRIYDQSDFCCPNCPVIDRDDDTGSLKLYDPDFPGQGEITFKDAAELELAFAAAVATGSLTLHHPKKDEAYSFKDGSEMQLFGQEAFAALEAAA